MAAVTTLPKETRDIDDILRILSTPNERFQLIQFIFLSAQYIPVAMNDIMPIFYSLSPAAVRCQAAVGQTGSSASNWTAWDDPLPELSRSYCNCTNGREFRYPGRQWSIIGDMDLVCNRAPLVSIATVLFFIGQMTASPFCGWFADKFGRRPLLLGANLLYTIASLALAFSKDYISFVILRFIVGLASEGIVGTFFVLLVEWTPPEKRSIRAVYTEFPFAFGILIITLMAYLLQNWMHIQFFMAASSIMALPLYWFAPESLSWSSMRNRIDKVEDSCLQVASFNGISISDELKTDIKRIAEEVGKKGDTSKAKTYTFADLFRTPVVRNTALKCFVIWFACFFGFLGLVYLSVEIANNIYLNIAINGFLELVPIPIAFVAASRFGRRMPLAMYFLVGGICSVLAGLIPGVTQAELIGQNVLAFLGRMAFTATTCVIFVFTTELFPTVIRHNSMSMCSMALRLGCVATPLLSLLSTETYKGGGFLLVGLVGILAALASSLLRETKGQNLPDTIEEAESFIQPKTLNLLGDLRKRKVAAPGQEPANIQRI